MNHTLAFRLFRRRMALATACYVAIGFIAAFLREPVQSIPGATHALAMGSALPVIAFFVVLGSYLLHETDEYKQLLAARQCLIATGFALTLATFYGFLEIWQLVPHIPIFFIGPTWFLGLGVGSIWNRYVA